MRRLDEGDIEEGGTGGGTRTENLAEKIEALRQKRGRYGAMLAELERTGENQISLTDPDSRAMAAHTKVGVGYNIQIAVDAKNKMIVEQEVTNQVVDMGLLTETASSPAPSSMSNISMLSPIAATSRSRISVSAKKAGMTPMNPNRNGDHR